MRTARTFWLCIAAATSWLGFMTGSGHTQGICLNPAVNYEAAQYKLTSIAAADLDGDGDMDLAVVDNAYHVSVLRNNGNGTFATAVDYLAGANPIAVRAADVDNDGDIDLVVANYEWSGQNSGSVAIMKNNGDGTFAYAVAYTAYGNPTSIVAADFDGDGDQDLAVTEMWGVIVLKNNGNGTFAAAINYGAGVVPSSVFAADLDGDGDRDLAAVATDGLWILKNNGDATFSAPVNYAVGANPSSVIAADFDADGDQDLAVAIGGTSPTYSDGNVSILENYGNGTFGAAVGNAAGFEPHSVFAADMDGDGDPDLAVANLGTDPSYTDGSVSVLLNSGNGTFAAAQNWMIDMQPYSIVAADLNGDGKRDLALAKFLTGRLSVLINAGLSPNVSAGPDMVLSCAVTQINLSGSSSTPGSTFSWFASNGGHIVSGGTTATPLVNQPGTYTLTVSNGAYACPSTDVALVTRNAATPNAAAGPDKALTCAVTQIILSGSSSTPGATFAWVATGGGHIVSDANTSTPLVDSTGTYTLTVINPVNGCTATDIALVTRNTSAPNVSAGTDQVLSCAVPQINLSGFSFTVGVTFSWVASDGGHIVSGAATATPLVDAAGTYTLTVTSPANGCTATDIALVTGGAINCCDCPHQGDIAARPTGDGVLDVFDVIEEIGIAFSGASDIQDPLCPKSRGDVDNNGVADVFDVIYLIGTAFSGGLDPVNPCAP